MATEAAVAAAGTTEPAVTVIGEVVGSFILSTLGLGIGAAAAIYGSHKGVTWFGDIWPTSFGWALCIALGTVELERRDAEVEEHAVDPR